MNFGIFLYKFVLVGNVEGKLKFFRSSGRSVHLSRQMRLYCRYTCNMLLCQRNKKDSMGESGQIITWVHVLLYLQHISDKQTQPYNKLQLKIIFTLSLTSPLQALNSAAHDIIKIYGYIINLVFHSPDVRRHFSHQYYWQ